MGTPSKVVEALMVSDNGTINAVVGGQPYTVSRDHKSYSEIKKAISNNDGDRFVELADTASTIRDYISESGLTEIKGGRLYYNDRLMNDSLSERIISMLEQGFPFKPMVLFLENLRQNPSKRAVDELFPFLVKTEHYKPLAITADGCFLAFKAVTDDYKDWYSMSVDNTPPGPGDPPKIIRMERNEVDDNWGVDCSQGYHVGSLSYLASFHANEGKRVVVKVNPKNVVTVPSQETNKCRVAEYEVLYEYVGELPLVVNERGEEDESLRTNPVRTNVNANVGRDDSQGFADTQGSPWNNLEDGSFVEDDEDYDDDDDDLDDLDDDDDDDDDDDE